MSLDQETVSELFVDFNVSFSGDSLQIGDRA